VLQSQEQTCRADSCSTTQLNSHSLKMKIALTHGIKKIKQNE